MEFDCKLLDMCERHESFDKHLCNETFWSNQLTNACVVICFVTALWNMWSDALSLFITSIERFVWDFLGFVEAISVGAMRKIITANRDWSKSFTEPDGVCFVGFSHISVWITCRWVQMIASLWRHPSKEIPETHFAAGADERCGRWAICFIARPRNRCCWCFFAIKSHGRWNVAGQGLFDLVFDARL